MVRAEHPKRRPDARSVGQAEARLHPPAGPRGQSLRFEPGGRVVASAKTLGVRLNDQLAAFDARVVGAGGVVLQFVVPPAVVSPAQVVGPFLRVGRAAVGLVKFIGPDQRPSAGVDGEQRVNQETAKQNPAPN